MRRVLPAILLVALTAIGLSACSATGSGTSAAKGCPEAKSGSVSQSISVSGGDGTAEPSVSVPSKLGALSTTQRTVVKAGTGKAVTDGALIQWSYILYNGSTGKKIGSLGYGTNAKQVFDVSAKTSLKGLAKALVCTKVGSRVVAVIPPADGFGSDGESQLGIGAKQDIVLVADVRGLVPLRAEGTAKTLPAGFPKVTRSSSGQPTVTIPSGFTVPTTTKFADTIVGTGAKVKSTDTVTVQYQGLDAATGKVFQQTWGASNSGPYTNTASGFVSGFVKGLVGQRVGSQVVMIIPAAEAYGTTATGSTSNELTGKNLIFVVDILAATPASS